MEMNKAEIIKRLMSVDNDMSLLDTTADTYSCIIVGGSALVLLEKIYRSTHDIDSMRDKDVEDIENELVYKSLDWNLLDKLIDDVCYGMLSDFDRNALVINYNHYKERFK